MHVLRVAKRSSFVVIDKATVTDARLSLKARGLLVFLLSKPDDWRYQREVLAAEAGESVWSIRQALGELKECGYVTVERAQDERGRWITESTVHERPKVDIQPSVAAHRPPEIQPVKDQVKRTKDTSRTSPDGEVRSSPNGLARRDVAIANHFLQPVVDKVRQGYAFDLAEEVQSVWTQAWQAAVEAELDPTSVGIQLCAVFVQSLTREEPDYGRIGRLVARHGKLALVGLAEAFGARQLEDPYAYAEAVNKAQYLELRAKERSARQ